MGVPFMKAGASRYKRAFSTNSNLRIEGGRLPTPLSWMGWSDAASHPYWSNCPAPNGSAEGDTACDGPATCGPSSAAETKATPIAVLFGWMNSERRHIKTYLKLYNDFGWDVLVVQPGTLNL